MIDDIEDYIERLEEEKRLPRELEEIKVKKGDEFYIAICNREDRSHTYIISGVMLSETKENKILCAFGKFDRDNNFINSRDKIESETFFLKSYKNNQNPEPHSISYKAFGIGYSQYIKLLSIFKENGQLTEESKGFFEAKSSSSQMKSLEEEKVLVLQEISKFPKILNNNSASTLTTAKSFAYFTNNCRHTAIEILEKVLMRNKIEDVYPYGPRTYSFPFLTYIKGNNLTNDKPFYIMPPPPTKEKFLDKDLFKILNLIYERIEEIGKKWQFKNETFEKFNALKSIYNKIIFKKATTGITLKEALDLIFDWENTNKNLIQTPHRGRYSVGKTKTEIMFEKIHQIHAELETQKSISGYSNWDQFISICAFTYQGFFPIPKLMSSTDIGETTNKHQSLT